MIGLVKPKTFSFDRLDLESGKTLEDIDIVYETYGSLNEKKDNAVLILHAFSGSAHAAGYYENDTKPGWWDNMIGPGKAFDSDKYFIICSNVLGGCSGSTGPASINKKTGKEYGLDFPVITIGDMAKAQKKLIDFLGIKKLLSAAGGSMGGMQVLEWMVSYPESLRSAIPIAASMRHSPQQIAFNEVARQAIIADANWKKGSYYGGEIPKTGLSLARMIGHITYMSDKSMEKKFARNLKNKADYSFEADSEFEVEGYLKYQGDSFVKRFDANSYLYISKAMDYFDVSGVNFMKQAPASGNDMRFLIIAFESDWLYPPYQSEEIARQLKLKGYDATYCEIKSTYGHDSFLLETDDETRLISSFLNRVYREGLQK
ncbi:MAG: homoserine O-acetyltransferase [Elusimicrobiota bacterium]|jgi:homoserine O-acetyltransferase|nr:homoserine O-acetyltransferase [Elusimicrobiota bacterium]